MDNVDVKKEGLFQRTLGFLLSLFSQKKHKLEAPKSRFIHYLSGIDESNENYSNIQRVIELCDESVVNVLQRISFIDRHKSLSDNISEIECFSQLTDEETLKLKDLLDRFVSLMRDKNAIRNQLSGFDRSLMYMKSLEGDAVSAVKEIKEAEEKQRIFKQDLAYLESENYQLEADRETFGKVLLFIHRFIMGLVVVFGAAGLLLGYTTFFLHMNMILPFVVVFSMLIVISVIVYTFRRRLLFEIELNVKKQQRAAELINKKTVVYAHYANFLNYEYTKYKVRNSDMLKETISDFGLYKHLNARLDAIRSILYQTENEIQEFLKDKNLNDIVSTVESFATTIDISNKRDYYNELVRERTQLDLKIQKLDDRQAELWDHLVIYQDNENSQGGLVDTIINECIDLTGKLISATIKKAD